MKYLFWLSLIITLLVACGQHTLPSVNSLVRGDRQILMRLPAQPGAVQEEILILDNERTDNYAVRREAVRGPADPTRPGVDMASYRRQQLLEATWLDINQLRDTWCRTPPRFNEPREGEPVYEIGIACPTNRTRRVVIPEADLPEQFRRLIAEVPSPA